MTETPNETGQFQVRPRSSCFPPGWQTAYTYQHGESWAEVWGLRILTQRATMAEAMTAWWAQVNA